MTATALIYMLSILSIITIALFVMFQSKRLAFTLFSAIAFCIAVFLLAQFFTDAQIGNGVIWLKISSFVGCLIAPLFLAFMYLFPDRDKLPRAYLITVLAPVVTLAPLSFSGLFIKDVITNTEGVKFVPGPLYAIQTGVIILYMIIGIFVLSRKLFHIPSNQKGQIHLLMLAFGLALCGSVLSGFVFPSSPYWQIARPISILGMVGIIAYAMVFYKLFDIRPLIARLVTYLFALAAFTLIYGFLIFGSARILFDLSISLTLQILLSVVTGIAALTFVRFKQSFDKITNKLFFQDVYDPQELFDEYNKALVSTIDLDVLLKRTSHVITKYLKAGYCTIGVREGKENDYIIVSTANKKYSPKDIELVRSMTPFINRVVIVVETLSSAHQDLKDILKQYDIAVLVRLTVNTHNTQEGLGYLALGPKKSGSSYTSQDIKVIEALANELIIALQNALRFEEIERFNETLQKEVNVATRQLQETNAKLRKVDRQKDEFIGMASHQLRTPLTSIKGYVSLVLDGDSGKITATQRKLLEQAFTSSQRMVYLIADLLNVSRLKSGKFVIERVPTNLAKVISDEMAQLKTAASTHNVELSFTPPVDFPSIPLDETKTRQVIMNFLDNAIYYTPTGGHIQVELRDLPKSIEFEVVDDGIGVPKAERHHLFTKFYRAKNAQRARPDGTGLGLFMAQKVIIAQGGAIIFDSKEGVGSKFGFSFPKDMPADSGRPIVIHE